MSTPTRDKEGRLLAKTATPWTAYDPATGVHTGRDGAAWLSRVIPLFSMEDGGVEGKLRGGENLANLLSEIGKSSTAAPGNRRRTSHSRYREVHLFVCDIPYTLRPDASMSTEREIAMAPFLANIVSSRRVCVISVRLRARSAMGGAVIRGIENFRSKTRDESIDTGTESASMYADDIRLLSSAMRSGGARIATADEINVAHSWWNEGRWPHTLNIPHANHIHIFNDSYGPDQIDRLVANNEASWKSCEAWPQSFTSRDGTANIHQCITFGSITDFGHATGSQSFDPHSVKRSVLDPKVSWIPSAFRQGVLAVSLRFKLEPGRVTEKEFQELGFHVDAEMQKQDEKGSKIGAGKDQMRDAMAEAGEHFSLTGEPSITGLSGIIAVSMRPRNFDWHEGFNGWNELGASLGLTLKPLDFSQLQAFDETQVCSEERVAPLTHDLCIRRVGYTGAQSCADVGETTGLYIGRGVRDKQPVRTDVDKGFNDETLPFFPIVGATGSGKTMLLYDIITQRALDGFPVILMDFKELNSNANFVAGVRELGVKCRLTSFDDLKQTDGVMDAFRYATRATAPGLALKFISNVNIWAEEQNPPSRWQARLERGLAKAADDPAVLCTGDALKKYVDDDLSEPILDYVETNPLFALGIGMDPKGEPLKADSGITIFERADMSFPLPAAGSDPSNWNLPTRAASATIELMLSGGVHALRGRRGLLAMDEAWAPLKADPSAVEEKLRIARSLSVMVMLATQRWTDIENLAGYMTRALVGNQADKKEAHAALSAIGVEPSDAAVEQTLDLAAKFDEQRNMEHGALWWFRDMSKRVALTEVLIPPNWLEEFSTNTLDRENRENRNAQRALDAAAAVPALSAGN